MDQVANLRDECRKLSLFSKKESIGLLCSKYAFEFIFFF
jgi:hypothetical protein